MMMASSIMVLAMSAMIGLFVMGKKLWYPSTLQMAATQKGDRALSRMVYGVSTATGGLRSAYSTSVSRWSDGDSWTITFNTNRWVMYNGVSNTLSCSYAGLLARNVTLSTSGINTAAGTCGVMIRIVESSGRTTITNTYYTSVAFRN